MREWTTPGNVLSVSAPNTFKPVRSEVICLKWQSLHFDHILTVYSKCCMKAKAQNLRHCPDTTYCTDFYVSNTFSAGLWPVLEYFYWAVFHFCWITPAFICCVLHCLLLCTWSVYTVKSSSKNCPKTAPGPHKHRCPNTQTDWGLN